MTVHTGNPLLDDSGLSFNAPDPDQIKDAHFPPAFKHACQGYLEGAQGVAENPAPPNFLNTIDALEEARAKLNHVEAVTFALFSINMTDARQTIQQNVLTMLAEADGKVFQNAELFKRVQAVAAQGDTLSTEEKRLTDDYMRAFHDNGIHLSKAQQEKLTAIKAQIATLGSQFGQEVLQQDDEAALVVDTAAELAGLDMATINQLYQAATLAGHPGKFLIKPCNATIHPLLASLANPKTRKRLFDASVGRGANTHPIAQKMLRLRQELAQMLGYPNFAEMKLTTQTAGNTDRVFALFEQMIPTLKNKTDALASQMEDLKRADGDSSPFKPWDWHFYAAQLQRQQGGVDADAIKPYFEFEKVLWDGVFRTARMLYGINVKPRPDLPTPHPDVRAYDIQDSNGTRLAVFYGDYFARKGKRGGAWKSTFTVQFQIIGQFPVILNACNIAKAPDGYPTLLTLDEVKTLFHEFGHALHELFSRTLYASNAGTNVPRDFVEFPSTFNEGLAHHPNVLQNYAFHHQTGEPLPPELLAKVLEQKNFNQAFDTFEYLAAAVLDLELHMAEEIPASFEAFQRQVLEKHGLDSDYILPRYLVGYFLHLFMHAYAAGYFSYLWSELLAEDALAFIKEQGGLTRENGQRLRDMILALGNSVDPLKAYEAYRGQKPSPTHLLKQRGIA